MLREEELQLQHAIAAINEIAKEINEFRKEINLLKYEREKLQNLNRQVYNNMKETQEKIQRWENENGN
jgi:hypothetical protein